MSIPGAADELAAIHVEFAEAVTYDGAGLSDASIDAVEVSRAGSDFIGQGASVREKAFEVRYAALPEDPAIGNTITDAASAVWRVIDLERHDDVSAWWLFVEAAA